MVMFGGTHDSPFSSYFPYTPAAYHCQLPHRGIDVWKTERTVKQERKPKLLTRLKRIEGQVRGLAKMIDEDRYCIDIVTQIAAVRAALDRAEDEILRDHVATCVEHAITSGDKTDQRKKIAELMDVFGRAKR